MGFRIAIIAAFALPLSLEKAVGDDALLERVRADYPGAAAKLEALYSRVGGSGTVTTIIQPGEPEERVFRSQCSFVVDHDLQKIERTFTAEPNEQAADASNGEEAWPHDEVFAKNSRYYFSLRKDQGAESYRVVHFGKPDEGESSLQAAFRDFLSTPYGIMGTPLSELIAQNGLEFSDARIVERDGRNLLEVVVKYDHPELPKPEEFVTCEMLVDPEASWVIREYKSIIHPSKVVSWALSATYDGELADGVPALSGVTVDLVNGTHRRFDVHEIERIGSLPERRFTLSAYGLPEMGQPAGGYATRVTFWFFGLAVAALVIAVVLKYYAGRLQRP